LLLSTAHSKFHPVSNKRQEFVLPVRKVARAAQALLPVPWLMHSMHKAQAGVPGLLKPEPATDRTR
jgi:hypothetical protein